MTLRRTKCVLNKLRGRRGFSLTEMLVVVVMVLIVTAAMAVGVSLATTQFAKSMSLSEGKILMSTLETAIGNELGMTHEIGYSTLSDGSYVVDSFFSDNYNGMCSFVVVDPDDGGYGKLATESDGENYELTTAASYTYDNGAQLGDVTYFPGDEYTPAYFSVELAVGQDSTELLSDTFNVTALNSKQINDNLGI